MSLDSSFDLVGSLSKELCSFIDKRKFMSVIHTSVYLDRVFGYEEYIRLSCSKLFRSYNGGVYYFNGRYWCELSDILLEQVLNTCLLSLHVSRGDIVKSRNNILRSAKQGVLLSPLRVSRCLVGFSNGVWDFTDIDNPVYHSFDSRPPVVSILPYSYDVNAVCPKWLSFLGSVLTPTQISLLRKYLSLGLYPRNFLGHKIEHTLWLVGNGANGKSVIFEVVKHLFGVDNISSVSLHNLIRDGDDGARFMSAIIGKVFNYCSELNSGDIGRHEGNFKSLCSGEPREYRRIGGNVELSDDIPYLIFNMNRKPSNRSMGDAFMRRLLLIHFRTTVRSCDMRSDLVDDLLSELSGIRNWLLGGFKELRSDGFRFIPSKESVLETEDYLLENGMSIQLFLRTRGYRSTRHSGHWEEQPLLLPAESLYNDYVSFCEGRLCDSDSSNMFGRELTRLGFGKRKRSSNNIYEVFCDDAVSYAL